jgi:hypothetical protein
MRNSKRSFAIRWRCAGAVSQAHEIHDDFERITDFIGHGCGEWLNILRD